MRVADIFATRGGSRIVRRQTETCGVRLNVGGGEISCRYRGGRVRKGGCVVVVVEEMNFQQGVLLISYQFVFSTLDM